MAFLQEVTLTNLCVCLDGMLARDSLLPWRTAQQNAEFGCEIRGVEKEIRRLKAEKLLEQVRSTIDAAKLSGS